MEHTILIVDDSERAREDMRDLLMDRVAALKMRPPDFVEATNGREAFEVLKGGLRPDLILLDCCMPEMDGIQLIDKIDAELGLDTPIIVFSASMALRSEVEKRGRNFYFKGARQEVDAFYEEALEAYKKSLRPSQLDAYRRQLAIKEQFKEGRPV